MMYPFMTLNDDTEIVHSEMKDGIVKVYIETPDEKLGFKSATCYLPEKKWENIYGYTEAEFEYLKDVDGIGFVELTAHDVVRHPMVQKILECYEKHENE